ncbi:MAG: hypothetical protein ACI9U6_000005 [Loktanella salsilacus]|jgi:hypothetical protein|uniref:DUF1403 family protein n=1 Tax=Loktanella salsilacus TaxID=195913 RepID=UPI003988AF54
MLSPRIPPENPPSLPRRLPAWIASARPETAEDAAFLAGAGLSALQLVLAQPGVPLALVRDRRALGAAEASVIRAGRPERAADLRDEVHLLRLGDQTGPAGAVFALWRQAVAKPISVGALHAVLPEIAPTDIATWLDAGQGAPVARACAVFEAVTAAHPRAEDAALILADAVLAQAMGNKMIMPLLGAHLTVRDLRKSGADLRGAGYAAVRKAAAETLMLSQDLRERAVKLMAITPKLRAKRTAAAVDLFLTRDAVSPSLALTGPEVRMSDRAARRLCDRLVELKVVRELSGRDTFRLYGL